MRGLFVWLVLLGSLVWGQGLEFGSNCEVPRPGLSTYCLKPSAVLQPAWNFSNASVTNNGFGLAFGIKLETDARIDLSQGASLFDRRRQDEILVLRAVPALWLEGLWQFSFLELYAQFPIAGAEITLGKRSDVGGPWDDTIMGREGRLGIFADLTSTADSSLTIDLAYFFLPDFRGGQFFAGVRSGPLRAGIYTETIQQPDIVVQISPRLGYDTPDFEVYWQRDRGFWSEGRLSFGLFDPTLADVALEGSVWWNPDFRVFDSVGSSSSEQFQAFFLSPQKLLFGTALSWQSYAKFGVEVSRAPVQNIRVFFRLTWP
jgi:hypothetical protein